MKQWSKALLDRTRDVLENLTVSAFSRPEGCCLKNSDGRFGTIALNDALNGNYLVRLRGDDAENAILQYDSMEMLIADGWVVD